MGKLEQFREQYPVYDDIPDAALADAIHAKFYADLPKDQVYDALGVGSAGPGNRERMAAMRSGTRPEVAAIKNAVTGLIDRAPGIIRATGQALQNVPENLATGAAGLRLANAELTMDVSRSDIGSLERGAAELRRVRDDLAQKQAGFSGVPGDRRVALQDEIARLRSIEGQLALLYDHADAMIAAENVTGKSASRRGNAAIDAIETAQSTMVEIEAEPGTLEHYLANAISASAEMAPALIASVFARNPLPAVTFMTAYSGGRAYVSGRGEGLDPSEARGYATLNALAEGIPEAVPVAVLIKPGVKFLTRIVKGAWVESAQEMMTEALQIGIDQNYITADMTWGEARQRIVDAGIIGSLAGPVMAGIVQATETSARAINTIVSPTTALAKDMARQVLSKLPRLPQRSQKPNAPRVAPVMPAPPPTEPTEIDTAAEAETEPTEAQKEAGNYKKGHVRLNGLDITIENPKGSERSGKDAQGKAWSVQMPAHYGYIKRTEGADGDHVDVYVGPDETSDLAFIVDQVDIETGKFDEHKIVLGTQSQDEALAIYDAGFSDGRGPERRGDVSRVTMDELRDWLANGSQSIPYKAAPPIASPAPKVASEASTRKGEFAVGEMTPDFADAQGLKVAKSGAFSRPVTDGTFTTDGIWLLRNDRVEGATKSALVRAGVREVPKGSNVPGERVDLLLSKSPEAFDKTLPISWRLGLAENDGASQPREVIGLAGDELIAIDGGFYGYLVNRRGFDLRASSSKPHSPIVIFDGTERIGVVMPRTTDFKGERLRAFPETVPGPIERGRQTPPKITQKLVKPPTKINHKGVELARKTAINQLRESALEIERRMKAGDDALVEVTITLHSGTKTTFRFLPTEAGLGAAKMVLGKWKKLPARTLAFEPPSAMAEGLHFDAPMPGWQPMWADVQQPRASDTIKIARETVKIPPAHRPVRRANIRRTIEGIIGPRLYTGKIRGKTTAGFYRRNNGEMRLRKFDDIEVMAHEIAHWLDFHSANGGAFTRLRKTAPKPAKDQMRALSYTRSPRKISKEGFAEYVRLWLTQYDVAVEKAPDFTKLFDAGLAKEKRLLRGFEELRREMHKYHFQGPLAQARGSIGQDESLSAITRRFMRDHTPNRLRQQAIDKIHGIKVAERTITGGIASAEASPFKLMQLVNGAGSLFDTIIADGTPRLAADGAIERRGKGLNEVFRPVYGLGAKAFDDFLLYMAGRRAEELLAQGRENLFSEKQIAEMVGLERPEFRRVFDDFQTFNREMLEFFEQMGLITWDQRAAFEANNQSYVPFHRVAEQLETGKSRGGSIIGARLTGGDRNLRDLADNITSNLMTNVKAAMISRAKSKLYAMLKASDDGAIFAVGIAPDSKLAKAHVGDMAKSVAGAMVQLGFGVTSGGIVVANDQVYTDVAEIEDALKANPNLLRLWQHNLRPRTKGTMVDSALIDGQLKYFEVRDPVLIDSLMAQEFHDLGFFFNMAKGVKRLTTRLITSMPPFLLPNIVRDTVSASAMSDSGFRPVVDSVLGLGHIVARSETYRDWQRNGGGYSSLIHATVAERHSRATLATPGRHPLHVLGKTLAAWDAAAALFENATRVGEFRRALGRGQSKTEATYRAREISTDFAKMPGKVAWTQLMRTVPFMNAALQGNDRTAKAFLGQDGRPNRKAAVAFLTRLTLRGGTYIAGFTALLWLINNDDERYLGLTADQKSRFWHIWIPGFAESLQVPKPYGIGFIFADLVENMLDYVKDGQGAEVAHNLAWAAGHHFWFMDYPGIVQPVIEAAKNETFTGAPVVPVYMQDLSPENQSTPRTPEIYQRAGEAWGMSPLRLQHYSRGFLGYLEMAFVDTTEAMLWDEKAFGPRPFPRGVDDYFFRQFKGARFPYRTKYTEKYYELRQRARTAAADLSAAQGTVQRRPQRLRKFGADNLSKVLAGLNGDFMKMDRALSEVRAALDAIKYDPALSQAEKERRIEKIYRGRNELLRGTYRDVSRLVAEIEREMKK